MKRDPNAVGRDRGNLAGDLFRPPDETRSPRPAATGSRAKRKDRLNAADNTDQKSNRKVKRLACA